MVRIIIVSFLFITTIVTAQSAEVTRVNQLSLQDAVFTALSNNYNIQISHKQVEIAEKNNSWGEAGAWPTVSLGVNFNNTIQDNTNNPFTFTPGLILSQSVSPSLNINWNIFSGFAVQISKERLELIEAQSKGNALALIESTAKDVIIAYYAAQVQKERLQLFADLMTFSRDKSNYYDRKAEYGTSSSLESLQFKNQYFTDSTNYLMQEVNHQNALRNLLLLMNDTLSLSNNLFPELTDKLFNELPEIEFDKAYNAMIANNQNLKNQYLAQELQKRQTELQKSFLYPTLAVQVGVSPSNSWLRDLKNPDMKFETQTINYFGNLSLRYNIFNNWKTKRAVEVAKIQEEIADLNYKSLETSMSTNLRNALALYEIRAKLADISSKNLEYAQKTWDLAKRKFDLGSVNSIELSTIQTNYQNTLLQHYENLFNWQESYLNVYQLMGLLGLEYVKN